MKRYNLEELAIENIHIELIDIDDIIDSGYKNCIDLSIEVDETYCINDGIISHNSARGTVLTGLSVVGRDYWGVFPIKGRPLNVRDVSSSKIINNDEIANIIKIIGLVPGKKYNNISELRYGKIIFFTDADCFEENTIVLTKAGEKKIKDITYDDYVLTHTGQYKKIINIIESIKTEMVSFVVSGTEYLCSKNHKLIVLRNSNTIIIYAKDLLKTDLVLIKKKLIHN